MKKKRVIWPALLLVLCLALTSCGEAPGADAILTDGAMAFEEGKSEEDFALISSEKLLDRLMDEYAGSRENPGSVELTDEESEKIQESADEDTVVGGDGTLIISSRQELKQAMHQMFDETKEVLNFQNGAGYVPSINEVTEVFEELQREDMYDVICLDQYAIGSYAGTSTITLYYTMDVDTLREMKKETRDLVQQAKSKIDVTGKSDYEIVCAVNDYLCDIIVYPPQEPYAPETHTAYSGLKLGSAVCDGYSRSAKLLLNEFGIECDFVVGDCPGRGPHAWNLVKLDGQWYQMDVTWNDGSAEWDPNGRSLYLLVTDEFMKESRVWDTSLYPATPSEPYAA